ncbi:MAG: YceI family protein [Bacteroidota bacterium]|jgi:polyisoprenoid-binding protein YceI
MKTWLKWALGILILVAIAAGGFAWWIFHKPHRNINTEIAVTIGTNDLLDAFKKNEKTASTEYTNKVLELTGIVKEASKNDAGNWVINIENSTQTGSITVAFSALKDTIQAFDSIAYKGICAGYFPEDNSVVINEAVLLFKSKSDTTKKITVSIEPVQKDTIISFSTKKGSIQFVSPTDPDVSAVNNEVSSKITAAGELRFSLLFKGFHFKYAEMQTHFNEEYVESEKYPRAIFTGTIQNIKSIDLTKDGKYTATIVGTLTMHGVTKPVQTAATLNISKGKIAATATISISMSDFNIDASAVTDKVDLEINCNYTQL